MYSVNNVNNHQQSAAVNLAQQLLTPESDSSLSAVADVANIIRPIPAQSEAASSIATALPVIIKNIFNGMIRMFDHMVKFIRPEASRTSGTTVSPQESNTPAATTNNGSANGVLDKVNTYIDKAGLIWDKGSDLAGKIWDVASGIGTFAGGWIGKAGGLLSKGAEVIKKIF